MLRSLQMLLCVLAAAAILQTSATTTGPAAAKDQLQSPQTATSLFSRFDKYRKRGPDIPDSMSMETYRVRRFGPTGEISSKINVTENCVPVMTVGVVADPLQFLPRLLFSIDHCILNLVLVKTQGLVVPRQLSLNPFIKNWTIIEFPYDIFGVSEGWNAGLKAFPQSKWFMIVAYDVEFFPGQISRFSESFWRDCQRPMRRHNHSTSSASSLAGPQNRTIFRIGFSNWRNLHPGGFNLFAISSAVVDQLGYFDENYFPAFYEDADFDQRMHLYLKNNKKPTNLVKIYYDIKPWHGEYIGETHNVSEDTAQIKYVSGTIYLSKVY